MKKIFLEDCEKDFLKNISKEVNKQHFEKKENTLQEEVLEEGIKYFKASTRLYKLANKLERKSKQNPTVIPTIKKINKLANKFEYVEDLYDVGRKEEAKVHYKELKEKYVDLLKILQKDEIRETLKKIGALSFTIASMTIPYMAMNHFFPGLSFSNVNKAAGSLDTKDQAALYLKRAGAFTLCGLPVRAANSIFKIGSDAHEQQILKSVDRLLKDEDVIS